MKNKDGALRSLRSTMETTIMNNLNRYLAGTAGAFALLGLASLSPAQAQVIGSYDNFDCFNDTGETAEGFEIDVEDINPTDLSREFPSNFSTTPWVIRYGLPTVTAYDFTSVTPDPDHSFDAGHKGVLITWAATWNGTKWQAAYGSQPFGASVAGDGTPYVASPAYTNGDSCWYYGLGAAYPTSGCDHFGISFNPGVAAGKMTYHWKVPDPLNPTVLKNNKLEASIPPTPVLAVAPPVVNQPPVVVAVAAAPVDAHQNPVEPQEVNPQYGDAYWLKTTTFYANQRAQLDALQKANVKKAKGTKTVLWKLVQKPPFNNAANGLVREAAENDQLPANAVQVTKQYEYFKFSGAYDSETHEALCDSFYGSLKAATAALAGLPATTTQVSCQNANGDDYPFSGVYYTIDPGANGGNGGVVKVAKGGDLGTYLGAHINAYNVQ